MKRFLLVLSLILLFAFELASVYFIMPMPGSQKQNSLPFAYWLHNNLAWIRTLLLVVIFFTALPVFRSARRGPKIAVAAALLLFGAIYYVVHFQMSADRMFYQPNQVDMAPVAANKIPASKLIIGITDGNEARAYPIQLIGYHHQVRDSINGKPIMITYCTVCRTGRVYSPDVNGKPENFRLVGMDHFNAMFEDETTRSWWQQVNGNAVAGPLKGKQLTEIPSRQMSLEKWLQLYPQSLILQQDSTFRETYEKMDKYDKGLGSSDLTRRDSASWNIKSWVIGIQNGTYAKAYDWNQLLIKQLIEDSASDKSWLIWVEKDSSSFHVFNRKLDTLTLAFRLQNDTLRDVQTSSTWNGGGWATDGPLKGRHLENIPAYQEFWHSWQQFHPGTLKAD